MHVVAIGDATHADFAECVAQLAQATRLTACDSIDDVSAFNDEPELIVLLASRPGEFSRAAVERLQQLAPLARVVGLLGSWCEGETRTGRPWPGVLRIYWHRWRDWFDRELQALQRGRCGTLSLPSTTTDEERFLRAALSEPQKATPSNTIVIDSPMPAMQALLSEACHSLGYDIRGSDVTTGTAAPPSFGICDLVTLDTDSLARLRVLVTHSPEMRWLALADFPRPLDVRRLHVAGAAAVISKPLALDDLASALARLQTGH